MRLRTLVPLGGLVAALLITLALSQAYTSAQPKFDPTVSVCLEDIDTTDDECDGDYTAGSLADLSINFSIGSDGEPGTEDDTYDVNFVASMPFIRQEFVVPDADVTTGALIGKFTITSTLGLLNQPCNTQVPITFDLIAASTDTTDTIPDEPPIPDPDWPGFADADGNGLQDAVDRYPAFLNDLFPNLTPVSRFIGFQSLSGQNVVLQALLFPPGSEFPRYAPGHPRFEASLGLPGAPVLQDPTAPPTPQLITDICTPFQTNVTSFAESRDNPDTADVNEGGVTLLTNPEEGPYTFTRWFRSARDADGDGFEQDDVAGMAGIDTCPLQANLGNPRVAGDGDADGDGLDAVCDPDDNDKNSDQDDDDFLNRQDNCTLVANRDQKDTDQDGIGDACDIAGAEITFLDGSKGVLEGPDTADGDNVELFLKSELVIKPPTGDDFPILVVVLAGVGGGVLLVIAGTVLVMRRRS